MAMVYVWSARVSKSGKPHRELLLVDEDTVPPGSGFESRRDAKQHGKRTISAPRR